MKQTRVGIERLSWLVVIAVVGGITLFHPESLAAGPKKNFSVVGWVKNRLTPEKKRSANRSRAVRPANVDSHSASRAPVPQPGLIMMAAGASVPPRAARPPESPAGSMGNDRSSARFSGEPTVHELRRRAEYLASRGLRYKFGGDHPSEGGMDCSGTMQFLLKSMGYSDIPRTSYHQYEWLRSKGTLRRIGMFHRPDRAVSSFRPGDLIFWGGTYNSGHKVSHVMIYLGKSRTGKHYIFGARGRKVKGLNGSGVDVFEYNPRSTGGRLIGYGPLPGFRG